LSEIQRRQWLRETLAAPERVDDAPGQFREDLTRFQVGAVCLANSPRGGTARAILSEAGFRRTIQGNDYELWVRSDVAARPAVTLSGAPALRSGAAQVTLPLGAFAGHHR